MRTLFRAWGNCQPEKLRDKFPTNNIGFRPAISRIFIFCFVDIPKAARHADPIKALLFYGEPESPDRPDPDRKNTSYNAMPNLPGPAPRKGSVHPLSKASHNVTSSIGEKASDFAASPYSIGLFDLAILDFAKSLIRP